MGPNAADQALTTPSVSPAGKAEPPRGNVSLKTDDKGRLKLPPQFVKYLQALGDTVVFITTLDKRSVRIYPLTKWREAEAWMQSPEVDPAAAERLWNIAYHWGGESEIDDQARILLPGCLRQLFGLVKADVHLCPKRTGRFDLLTDSAYALLQEDSEAHNRNDIELANKYRMP